MCRGGIFIECVGNVDNEKITEGEKTTKADEITKSELITLVEKSDKSLIR